MARQLRDGLLYFPFDVDFFHNRKIRTLLVRHGSKGVLLYVYILCEAYKNGFYCVLDEDFVLCASDDLNMKETQIRQILSFLTSRSLLDSRLADQDKILTATGIQRRFQEAKKGLKRMVEVKSKFWLLDKVKTLPFIKICDSNNKSEINTDKSEKNNVKSEINDTKESKGNKSKVNERSVGEQPTLAEVQAYCKDKAVNAERFYLHYQARGWKIGNTPITDWRALVDTWDIKDRQQKPQSTSSFDIDLLDRMLDTVPSIND